MKYDISVVLTLHAEGRILHRTLKALYRAILFAQKNGKTVEVVAVKDNVSDPVIDEVLSSWQPILAGILRTYDVDFKALSLARNYGVWKSEGEFISILDGDDLYGESWLLKAQEICRSDHNLIAHPECFLFFPVEVFLRYCNRGEKAFLELLGTNQWPALSVAHRSIFETIPYVKDDEFFAYQDWLWNCETAACGYRHVVVPGTLMAIRQKTHGKSLWQNSFSLNKAVRPNMLFRKIFMLDYRDQIESAEKDTGSATSRLKNVITKKIIKTIDYLNAHHKFLYQFLIVYKRKLQSAFSLLRRSKVMPSWVNDELAALSELEPTIRVFKRPRISIPDSGFRMARAVESSMAELVQAGKPRIYIVGRAEGEKNIIKALCYIYAVGSPVFVISTEGDGGRWLEWLPEDSVHITLSNKGLIYEERLKLLHRLLLESAPDFIHVFSSSLAFDMFDRYHGTFKGQKVFAGFFSTPSTNKSNNSKIDLAQYAHLFEFFSGITTDTPDVKAYLMDTFGLPPSRVTYHQIPPLLAFVNSRPELRDLKRKLAATGRGAGISEPSPAAAESPTTDRHFWDDFTGAVSRFYGL